MLSLRLLPYQPAFLQPFIEWRYQTLSVRHNPLKSMSRDEIEKMLAGESADLTQIGKVENFRWFIFIDGEAVGTISLKNVSHSMGYGELGYGIAEKHHSKGMATAALRIMIEKIFCETSLRKLIAYVHEENKASCRVLEKTGLSGRRLAARALHCQRRSRE